MTIKKAAHVSDERAQEILDRAAAQGRKLRQDEKAKIQGPPILLAHSFEDYDIDPTGWWMSEKLDGVRAYWDGKKFISRQGNVYEAPEWFTIGLPTNEPLDGELWMGRQMFQRTVSVVRSSSSGDRWRDISYEVFDVPNHGGPIEERIDAIDSLVFDAKAAGNKCIHAVEQHRCQNKLHLKTVLDKLVALGAEGVMIRRPESLYEAKRSHTIYKVKPFKDAEAVVIGHEPGTRRNAGRLGALVVRLPDSKEFRIGTGFSDAERDNPPRIGAHITFRFTETTEDGIPKCASFVCVRDYE